MNEQMPERIWADSIYGWQVEFPHDRTFTVTEYIRADLHAAQVEEARSANAFPDIGNDPLKVRDAINDQSEASLKRLKSGLCIQQKNVPDQTALVWRIDISRVTDRLILAEARLKNATGTNQELTTQIAALTKERDEARVEHAYIETCAHINELRERSESLTAENKRLREALEELKERHENDNQPPMATMELFYFCSNALNVGGVK